MVRWGLRESGWVKSARRSRCARGEIDFRVGELVRFLDGAVEVGADDEALEVANDEQRRVEQAFAVAEELFVGGVEVGAFALVFPGEAAGLPDVGEAALPGIVGGFAHGSETGKAGEFGVLEDVLLEAEGVVRRGVGLGGGGQPEQTAEVVEVFLVRGGFLAGEALPLGVELGGGHAGD